MTTQVELENDRVRVLRVKYSGRSDQSSATRGDRLIVYLEAGHVVRTGDGNKEAIHRKRGDVVWRDHSSHQISNVDDSPHEVVIIEFK
jgi:hypothetical protein